MSAPFGTPWKDDKLSLGREGRRWKEVHVMDLIVYRDLTLGDDLEIYFGTANDVSMVWDGTDFLVRPVTDDTGTFKIGDGTTDMDFKWFGGATTKYVLFDVGNALLQLEDVDLKLGDNDILQFGDASGGDVSVKWNATNLQILPAVDDTGAIHFGDGTTDMDVKFFVSDAAKFVLFDVGNVLVQFDDVDLKLGDNDILQFGDATGGDVSVKWNATNLQILPAADDTGAIHFGDGTTDMDVKFFVSDAAKFVLFDIGNVCVQFDDVDLKLGDNDILQFGDGADITMQWNGSTFGVAAAADSQAILGGSQFQLDLKHYGNIDGYNNEADATGYAITAYKSRGAADTALSDNDVVLQLTGIGFNDNATPAQKTLGNLKLLMTDVTDTTEDGAFVFETMVGGVAAAEKFRIADVLTASAAINVGVDGTGYDVQFFGDTAGCKFMWDQSEDQAVITRTTATATATTLRSFDVGQTHTGASAVNSAEVGRFVMTSAVQVGSYANALMAKVDFSTAGYVTGLVGVVCAELDMPAGAIPGGAGTYSLFEAEINCPTSYVGNNAPIHVIQINAWGAEVAQFDANGYLFAITGATSGATSFWYDHQGGAPANVEEWIRVKTPAGDRWLALYNAVV